MADDLKKDRIKDMHAYISNMILMASATESDQIGTFCNSFKLFYNSKNQGYTDLELHHQFNAKDFQNVGFAKGTVLALWLGLLKRSNPTVLEEEVLTSSTSWSGTLTSLLNTPLRSRLRLP